MGLPARTFFARKFAKNPAFFLCAKPLVGSLQQARHAMNLHCFCLTPLHNNAASKSQPSTQHHANQTGHAPVPLVTKLPAALSPVSLENPLETYCLGNLLSAVTAAVTCRRYSRWQRLPSTQIGTRSALPKGGIELRCQVRIAAQLCNNPWWNGWRFQHPARA